MRHDYPVRLRHVIEAPAAFTGASTDELLLTRNLTESFNRPLRGYPFRPGDGVVLAQLDYDSVVETLDMVASRIGLELTRVDLPLDPASDEQIVALYEDAIGPRTRQTCLRDRHACTRSPWLNPSRRLC